MPSYISPEGHRKIVEEYTWLLKTERPRITAEVTYAASLGDRSDNAEYRFGKQRLREIDRRLQYLGKRLDGIEVVDASKFTGDTVLFGATVDFEDEEGATQTWTILGEDEVDTEKRHISYVSPLGRALLTKKTGDIVEFETPKGRREVTILAVRYPRG
ncbi:MAG: transcription elongation factor GreB [Myxococcota bacterium]